MKIKTLGIVNSKTKIIQKTSETNSIKMQFNALVFDRFQNEARGHFLSIFKKTFQFVDGEFI